MVERATDISRPGRVFVDVRLWNIADDIASEHVTRGWFESSGAALIRKLRLRTAIYNALFRALQGQKT